MKIILTILLIGCGTNRPMLEATTSPEIRKVNTKIIIRGDSNMVDINYYFSIPNDSTKNN